MKCISRVLTFVAAIAASAFAPAAVFNNATSINLPASHTGTAPGSPYPSPISVSGLSGTITKVTVTLNNINHSRPDDLQILLVGPTGKKFVLLSDAGGTGTPAAGVNLTFDDAAASLVPDAGPLVTGTFRPTCVDAQANIQTEFAPPAPAGPYDVPTPRASGTLALTFNGTAPNGTWNLYVVDDIPSTPGGSISGGWTLNITTGSMIEPSVTTVVSSQNPSQTGSSVTFTGTVQGTNNAAITSGSVVFREGFTLLASNALNGSGQATFTTSALSEGSHIITAEYTGNASFFGSSATVTQVVNNATTVNGNTFANLGSITVNNTANVYPSRIFVTGLSGGTSKVTMTVSNISHPRPDDLELLLVAPNGAHFLVMADAGGVSGIANVTFRFDDAAANLIPDASSPGTGTYRPTDYNSTDPSFPPPAPSGPYNHAAPSGGSTFANVFNGANPNGTWSLYIVDDVAGDIGTIAGGWSLTFTTSGDAATFTTLTSSVNPSLVGQNVTFTATVRRSSNSNAVSGTVTFREGPNVIASGVALNASGVASVSTAILGEGSHVITADYSGVPGSFNVSSATVTQRVDNVTVVSSNRYSNPGVIAIPANGDLPLVYPSRILVSNAPSVISNITVDVSGINIDRPDDLELLLVSPTGAHIVLLSDAGGTATPANGVSLTFTDAAGGFISDSGPLMNGTFKPTSVNSSLANFPPPAPGGPYNHPGPAGTATLTSVFGGTNPNGYWSLYALDDVAGAGAFIAGGWSISILGPPAVSCPVNIVTTNALGQCQSAPVPFAATVSGFPTPTVTYRIGTTPITSPFAFPVGVTTVSVVASNSIGTNSCSFTVTVNDVQRPIIQCSTNIIISRHTNQPFAPVAFNVSASDNCGSVNIVATPPSGADFGFGLTTVNVVAYDTAGNSNTCSFTVRVNRNPVAVPDFLTTPTNTALLIPEATLLANDSDADNAGFEVKSFTQSANGGSVTLNGATRVLTYRPPTNFFGLDYFHYTIGDALGGVGSSIAFVTVTRPDAFRLRISRTNSGWNLRFIGAPGHTYLIQSAAEITGPWNNLFQVVAPTNTVIQTNDLTAPQPAVRFYRAIELPQGGVSLWRGENNAADAYGSRNGTLQNGLGFASGRIGRAFNFDGVDDFVSTGAGPIPPPWTATMWVNRQPAIDPSAALLSDPVSALKLEQWPNTQQVGFTAFGIADYYFNYIAPVGTWTHLTFVGSAGGVQLYVNGEPRDFIAAPIQLPTQELGRGVTDRLHGLLDEVQVFNHALAPVEVQALYYSTP